MYIETSYSQIVLPYLFLFSARERRASNKFLGFYCVESLDYWFSFVFFKPVVDPFILFPDLPNLFLELLKLFCDDF